MLTSKRRRQWASLEAESLMECTGLGDPVVAMHKLVDDLLQEAEQAKAPINLPVVASLRGIVDIQTGAMKAAAMLVPTCSGLRILVNANDPIRRRNFSAAHEICHTLFPDYLKNPVTKVDKFMGQFSVLQEEEYFCDIGASRLLLPPPLVYPKVSSCNPCLDAVIQLAEDFQCSLEAAAIAWARASVWPCAVVFFEESLKPSQVKRKEQLVLPGMENDFRLEPELRIALACPSATFPWFLPKHKSVRRNGSICKALVTQGRTEGMDILELRDESRQINTESFYAPYRKGGNLQQRVVTFVSLL